MAEPDANTVVTVERDGRTLSGAGVTAESLESTMDRHMPDPVEPSAPASDAPPAGPGSPPGQAKPTRGQARFSELTEQRKAAEARAEAAERERDEIKTRLSQAPSLQPPAGQGPPAAAAPAAPQPRLDSPQPNPPQATYTRPEPSEDEIGDKYPTYAAFTRAQTEWVLEQQQAQFDQRMRAQIDADRQRQAFDAHVESTRAKGRAIYKDFDAMLTSGPGATVDMPMPAVHAIYQHPQSEHLQYQIMKDGGLAQRLAQLAFQNPFAFAMELTKLAPAPAATNGNGHAPPPPAPMQPVGSGSRTTTTASAEHAKRGDYAGYKAARAAERRGNRR